MRMRFIALASLPLVAAGCGTGTLQGAAGQTGGAATTSVSPSAVPSTTTPSATGAAAPAGSPAPGTSPAGTDSAGAGCRKPQAATVGAGTLTGLEFVSASRGWAVGQDAILATSDGGAHWTTQLSGPLNLTSADFISARDGWAVGTTSLLATTDGGAHWTPLPEPCQTIRSVHFISPTTGFAVAGGNPGGSGPAAPLAGGALLATSDGGRTWQAMTAPSNAQTVCFSDPQHGWLGADGLLYRTADGGKQWTALTSMAGQVGSGPAIMNVECASDGTAWAVRIGADAAMSQTPHVGYHADQAGATPIFAEQYFQSPGAPPTAESPGPDPGPFSALSPSAAVFIDYCSACGYGTAPWDVATGAGTTLAKEGNVGSINDPQAASFQSPEVGWVAGTAIDASTATTKTQERIVATADGGRSWHVEWSGPWSS